MSYQGPFEFYFGNGAEGGNGTDGYSYGYVLAKTTNAARYGYKFDGYLCDKGPNQEEHLDEITIASICLSLGFNDSSAIIYSARGEGNHKIPYVLEDMWCEDITTTPALNCSYSFPVGFSNCGIYECLWVSCTGDGLDSIGVETDPVLTDGDNNLQFMVTGDKEGYLYTPSGWVCDDSFGDDEAKVVCFEMGLGLSSYETGHTLSAEMDTGAFGFGPSASSMGLDELQCSRNPVGITSCYYTYDHDCDHNEGVYLDCTGPFVDLRADSRPHNRHWMVATGVVTLICVILCLFTFYLSWHIVKCGRRSVRRSHVRESSNKMSVEILPVFDPNQPGVPRFLQPHPPNESKSYLEPKVHANERRSNLVNRWKLSPTGGSAVSDLPTRDGTTVDSLASMDTPPSPPQISTFAKNTRPGEISCITNGSYEDSVILEATARISDRIRGISLDGGEGEPVTQYSNNT